MRPPGSKSLTIRALAAAALAEGRSHIYGPLLSDDTMAMKRCLRDVGVGVRTEVEPWEVEGRGGRIDSPRGPLDAGESALTARLLVAMAALGRGETEVTGGGTLARRPMVGLVETMRQWGVEVDSKGEVPVRVSGLGGLRGGPVTVDASQTSQFATAALMVSPMAEGTIDLRIDGLRGSRGYLDMTVSVMTEFAAAVTPTITGYEVESTGYSPADYVVEPDASAAVYPMLAAAITGGRVELTGLTASGIQPDLAVAGVLETMGCRLENGESGIVVEGPRGPLRPFHGDLSTSPDGALAVAVACVFADGESVLSGLGSLRHKESDRLSALATELRRLGAGAAVSGDTLRITPAELAPTVIEPHGDHRIAMAFAPVGLMVGGLRVADPDVVKKTWPGFWTMLDGLAG